MVKRAAQFILLVIIASRLVAADTPKLPANYRIGTIATEDVVTPVPLTVIDSEATDQLRQQELSRLPIIYRFNPNATDAVERAFRNSIRLTREKFLEVVQKSFGTHKLVAATINSPRFEELAVSFQYYSPAFPAGTNLLSAWAKGESDENILLPLTGKLRDAMSRYIRPENLPNGMTPSDRARIVITKPEETLTAETVDKQYDEISRNSIPSLARVRANLIASFPVEEGLIGRFLADLLVENCVPDSQLTRLYQARQTEALLSADHYDAGQLIVKKGQIIDSKVKAALNQLAEKLRLGQLQLQVAENQMQARLLREKSLWLIVALASVAIVSGFAIWRITALRRQTAAAPSGQLPMKILGAESDGMVISCPTCQEHIVVPFDGANPTDSASGCEHLTTDQWKHRALLAERRAEQAAAMVRAGMLSQIAQYLTNDVIKKLMGQRNQLINEQSTAAKEMQTFETRLAKADGDWKTMRRFYEQRIAELEKDLSESNEVNRALIKTKIAAARRQLASAEAEHKRTHWN